MPGEESTPTSSFVSGFMDDYFAECDEHVGTLRRALLALEHAAGRATGDSALLEQIFRTFHSLKGLSGMVDLRDAERLAHELEGHLRTLRTSNAMLSHDDVDWLIEGARALEEVIAAHRERRPGPDVEVVLRQLNARRPADTLLQLPLPSADAQGPTTSVGDGGPAAAAVPPPGSRRAWKVIYVPSATVVARGVNVNTVRARLQDAGEIIQAAPKMLPGGGVSFEFIVLTNAADETLLEWRDEGVTVTPHQAAGEAVAPPQETAEAGPRDGREEGVAAIVAPSHFVRVDLTRLDELMRIIGDLVIARARLGDDLAQLKPLMPATQWRALQETGLAIERHLRDLRQGVMRVRLVSIGEIFERMVFVVRDLARDRGKRVRLDLAGQTTEIDKFLVERMMDPVLHLVRNAVDHGLETPDERVAQGKPPEGTLALRATTAGEAVVIEIEDDGRGIDAAGLAARARSAGLAVPPEVLDHTALLDLVCAPGVSTRDAADRVSGRGVGMAVVRTAVNGVGGSLSLETKPGRGSRFTLHLPLTLAITDALIATVGDRTFAVPQGSVREVIAVEAGAIQQLENNEIVPYRDGVLPILRLSRLFGLPESDRPALHVFVVGAGLGAVGLGVDRIIGQREIVVRTFADTLIKVDGIAGATELGDGRAVLIVDAAAVSRHAIRRSNGRRAEPLSIHRPTPAGKGSSGE